MEINHADIPGFLRSQGAIGQGMYDRLLAAGHNPAALNAAIQQSGITVGQKLKDRLGIGSASAASTPQQNNPLAGFSQGEINNMRERFMTTDLSNLNEGSYFQFGGDPVLFGKNKSGYNALQTITNNSDRTTENFKRLASQLGISGVNSINDLRQMQDALSGFVQPQAPAGGAGAGQGQGGYQSSSPDVKITDQSQQYRDRTAEILAQSDAKLAEFMAGFQAMNAASEAARAREAKAAAQRQEMAMANQCTAAANMYRGGMAANLQIAPAGGLGSTDTQGGTSGFRRRALQFNPSTFGGLATIASGMVNL